MENNASLKLENVTTEPKVDLADGAFLRHKDYSFEKMFHLPNRVIVTPSISKKDDFVAFVNKYKKEGTAIFYDTKTIKAVFNYPTADKPDYADSHATMALARTDQFTALTQAQNGKINQKTFIFLLKTLTEYIKCDISAAQAIELAENLKAVKEVHSINTNLNNTILQSKTAGNLKDIVIPKSIGFELPIFKADTTFKRRFDLEIFIDINDSNQFEIELKCWTFDEQLETATTEFLETILKDIEDVPSYFC